MPDTNPALVVPIDAQIACLKREIALRKNVYPGWVARQKMTQEKADAEIAAMTAALQTLFEHRGEGNDQSARR